MGLLDLAIFNHQSVALATVVSENRSAVELEVQRLRKGAGRVSEEADLYTQLVTVCVLFPGAAGANVRRSCQQGPAIRPTPS